MREGQEPRTDGGFGRPNGQQDRQVQQQDQQFDQQDRQVQQFDQRDGRPVDQRLGEEQQGQNPGAPAFEDGSTAGSQRPDALQGQQDPAVAQDPFLRQEQMLAQENGELPPKAPEYGAPEDGTEHRG